MVVTLPFVLTRAGFSVAIAGSIAAAAAWPTTWRFLFAPVIDLSLTLRRWYLLGLTITTATIVLLGVVPIGPDTLGLITIGVLLSGVGSAVLLIPVVAMTAHCVEDAEKGRAAGWFQAGNLAGIGLGGSAGVWLASHTTVPTAAVITSGAMLVCAVALTFVPDVTPVAAGQMLGRRLHEIWRDFRELTRSAEARFVIVLFLSPVGAGAMNLLWSAVAPSWRATPDHVAVVSAAGFGLSAAGCVTGGWFVDRVGRWWVFFGSQARGQSFEIHLRTSAGG